MNTSYRILCLSHDPAIILEPEWGDAYEALSAVASPDEHVKLAHHAGCDLLVGAWSPRLEALACPPRAYSGHPPTHAFPEWLPVDLARVLGAAHQIPLPDAGLSAALKHLPACWSPTRIHRLRELLLPAPVAEPVLAGTPA